MIQAYSTWGRRMRIELEPDQSFVCGDRRIVNRGDRKVTLIILREKGAGRIHVDRRAYPRKDQEHQGDSGDA